MLIPEELIARGENVTSHDILLMFTLFAQDSCKNAYLFYGSVLIKSHHAGIHSLYTLSQCKRL